VSRPRPSHIRAWLLVIRIGYNRNRSRSDGLIYKLIAVVALPAQGNKDVSRLDFPGIVFETADGRIPALRQDLRAIEKLLEIHFHRL